MRALIMAGVLALGGALAPPARADQTQTGQTLADIRQELSFLYVEVQKLRRELSMTGAPGVTIGGGSVLDRVDAIEAELQRLTARSEQMDFRINAVVSDGTNRIGDLEFRLCELEPGCDIASLGQTSTLGGGAAPATSPNPVPSAPLPDQPQLAIGEKADFERAQEALATGDFRTAADLFATFGETYPGGPMTAEAHLRRGEALSALAEPSQAARAYLEAFSIDQAGPWAPDALFRLGEALGHLGQTQEACVTLSEVGARFPGAEATDRAAQARGRIGCP